MDGFKPRPKSDYQRFQQIPKFTKYHPMIPRRYVMQWKTDMINQQQLLNHANLSKIYAGPHDESLYLQKRERLNHVEARCCVDRKVSEPDRIRALHPLFYHHLSRYQSGLMYRHDNQLLKCPCQGK